MILSKYKSMKVFWKDLRQAMLSYVILLVSLSNVF